MDVWRIDGHRKAGRAAGFSLVNILFTARHCVPPKRHDFEVFTLVEIIHRHAECTACSNNVIFKLLQQVRLLRNSCNKDVAAVIIKHIYESDNNCYNANRHKCNLLQTLYPHLLFSTLQLTDCQDPCSKLPTICQVSQYTSVSRSFIRKY